MRVLTIPRSQRVAFWEELIGAVEAYIDSVDQGPVSRPSSPEEVRAVLEPLDFGSPMAPEAALSIVVEGLRRHQVHTSHRRYFGLFNPNPTTMGMAADLLAAAFNPQLAAWGHSPFACEVESHVVRKIAVLFGYDREQSAGSFTSGGAEANHTGLLAALTRTFPAFPQEGIRRLSGQPVLYVSEESHHSFAKAARLCGLGDAAVVHVPLDEGYVMDVEALAHQIGVDRALGNIPFLVVATMGSTNAGLIDPIDRIADVAGAEGLWLHADAAWGGAAVMARELRPTLGGIERADSITFDAHKWLSLPMGAGMFFTRHPDVLEKTFGVDTQYMPLVETDQIVEPHRTTIQWSRRFIGLKLFLTLLVAGWEGYEEAILHQYRMGKLLGDKLVASGWRVVAETPLPTVCFEDGRVGAENSLEYLSAIARSLVDSGKAWISTTRIGGIQPVLRATITNYRTDPSDLDALVADLGKVREE
jgi:glutamate/tyrosine decarboxylase-like PLP-dependent enzyme